MSKPTKAMIKQAVLAGDLSVIDMIYHTVAQQQQNYVSSLQQQTNQQQINQAYSPSPYKAIRTTQPTFQDNLDEAKKTKNFRNVFVQMAQREGLA
jgi:hypothetical protein